ncbi:MAG: hypothetical protein HY300_08605, partial [Verrucomicrobia bacterium]|nr:hypothetical protein [Verrucomicrobiota bacterium]
TATRRDEVTLEEMPFNDQFMVEQTQQLQKEQNTMMIWDTVKYALAIVVAVGILAVFLRTMKRTSVEDIPIGIPLSQLGGHLNGNGNGNGHHREGQPGVVTVDVLNQLIRENPANMTQAVRVWMTRGKGGG